MYRMKEIQSAAEAIGITTQQAVALRVQYLNNKRASLIQAAAEEVAEVVRCNCPVGQALAASAALAAKDQADAVQREIRLLHDLHRGRVVDGRLTDDEIDRAESYPIERLIAFDRGGKALAPCHPDKRPSLTWYRKGNVARCWPCDRTWGPISWCMDQMGMTYRQAVKYLNGGGDYDTSSVSVFFGVKSYTKCLKVSR